MKPVLKFWPFSVISPPYPPENQRLVRVMLRFMDVSQSQLWRRFKLLVLIILILWLVFTKRLTIAKLRKLKNGLSMAITMLR